VSAKQGKLEALLARIQRNAAKPRPASSVVSAVAPSVGVGASSVIPVGAESIVPVDSVVPLDADEIDVVVESPVAPVVDASSPSEVSDVEDLLADEIEDLTEQPDEAPPASSRRPIAASLDEALNLAAESQAPAAEREAPPITAPPESGRQPLPAPAAAALAPARTPAIAVADDIDDLLEADISGPAPQPQRRADQPTLEQLGGVIELEEQTHAELELDVVPAAPAASAPDELELDLPRTSGAGSYDDSLRAPPSAREDLDRHREREGSGSAPPKSGPRQSAPPPGAVGSAVHASESPLAPPARPAAEPPRAEAPFVVSREPVAAPHVARVSRAQPRSASDGFVAALDASLGLDLS
jgi:hypothetical protein